MKITHIEFAWLEVPLITPFSTALRTVDHIRDLVVILHTTNGMRGYGSAPATPVITGDTHESIKAAIDQVLAAKVIGRDMDEIEQICHDIQQAMPHNSSAKAALEIALFDLYGHYRNAPLYRLLGGNSNKLKTDITISVNSADKMLADCEAGLARGFDVLKVKVGKQPQQDIDSIRRIYQLTEGRAKVRLDVNQGWQVQECIDTMQKLEAEGIELELIEQPIHYRDIEGMRRIRAAIKTPLMADEAAFSLNDVHNLIARDAADIVNIKLMKSGGISQAIAIAELANQSAMQCMIGCMLEGSIGVAAASHLASGKADQITLIDLDGPSLGQYDPVKGGCTFENANITLGSGPGLGISQIDGLREFA